MKLVVNLAVTTSMTKIYQLGGHYFTFVYTAYNLWPFTCKCSTLVELTRKKRSFGLTAAGYQKLVERVEIGMLRYV